MSFFEETAEDLLFEPKPGCCADCDDEFDFLAWSDELAEVPS